MLNPDMTLGADMAGSTHARRLLHRYLQRYRDRIEVLDADAMAARLRRTAGRREAPPLAALVTRDLVIEAAIRSSVSTRWGRAAAAARCA